MNGDRTGALTLILFVMLILSGGILCGWIIDPPENLIIFALAMPIGGATGLLICQWLHKVWDPESLSSKNQHDIWAHWLLFIIALGEVIFIYIISLVFHVDFFDLLTASLGVSLYITLAYLWVEAFRHRHK